MSDEGTIQVHNPFLLGNRTYDFIKKLVQIILPAFSSAYFALAAIWELPHAEKVVGTTAVVTAFLGVCLGISSAQYTASGKGIDGNLAVSVTPTGQQQVTGLHLSVSPEDLKNKDNVTIKVQRQTMVPELIEDVGDIGDTQ